MSWHCLQEQAEGFSVERYLAGVALVRLRSRNTPAECCSNGSETASCLSSPSGTMCAPSMGDHGAGSWMSSPAGSPAKTSVAPEKVQDSQGRAAGFGARCTELLARYDHAMHLWRTPQCSLLAGLDEFSETWPKSGIMLHGCAYLLPIAVPRTSANASGYLRQTPNNVDFFHTPTCHGLDGGSNSRKALRKRLQHLMPTPTACNAPNTGANTKGPKSLLEVARTGWNPGMPWPTPTAQDSKLRANPAQMRRKSPPLSAVVKFPTPTCHDAKLAHPAPNKTAQGSPCLTERVLTEEGHNGGTLNPTWVEWLMGWPLGWTDLKPLETGKFLSWLQQHSRCCAES